MFDFDAGKLLIVGVVALIFIPPKDLPRVLRQVGQFVGKMRRMASEFQGQFMDAMREADMADLRQEARKLADAARINVGIDSVTDLKSHLAGAIEGKPMMLESTSVGAPMGDTQLTDPNPDLRRLVGGNGGGNGVAPAPDVPPRAVDASDKAEPRDAATSARTVTEPVAHGFPEPAASEPAARDLAMSEKASAVSRSA